MICLGTFGEREARTIEYLASSKIFQGLDAGGSGNLIFTTLLSMQQFWLGVFFLLILLLILFLFSLGEVS